MSKKISSIAKIRRLNESIINIDLMAEAGLCQMTVGGKHAFLKDIRRIICELGIQGGLTEFK